MDVTIKCYSVHSSKTQKIYRSGEVVSASFFHEDHLQSLVDSNAVKYNKSNSVVDSSVSTNDSQDAPKKRGRKPKK